MEQAEWKLLQTWNTVSHLAPGLWPLCFSETWGTSGRGLFRGSEWPHCGPNDYIKCIHRSEWLDVRRDLHMGRVKKTTDRIFKLGQWTTRWLGGSWRMYHLPKQYVEWFELWYCNGWWIHLPIPTHRYIYNTSMLAGKCTQKKEYTFKSQMPALINLWCCRQALLMHHHTHGLEQLILKIVISIPVYLRTLKRQITGFYQMVFQIRESLLILDA